MSERATYTLTIRPTPERDDPQGIRRLRWLLKRITRGAGFTVVECKPAPQTEDDRPT